MKQQQLADLRVALLAMGYREHKPGQWVKPCGWHLFTFDEAKEDWCNWFMDGSKKLALFSSHEVNEDTDQAGSFLLQIKEFEAHTRTDVSVSFGSEFEHSSLAVTLDL